MKNVVLGAVALFLIGMTSCSKDKCLNCSYIDSATTETVTLTEVCGGSLTLDLAQAGFETQASSNGGTADCTRN